MIKFTSLKSNHDMLNKLHLKIGDSAEATPISIPAEPITVFVGPNNSGKSLILREIQSFFTNGRAIDFKILSNIDIIGSDHIDDYLTTNEIDRLNSGIFDVPIKRGGQHRSIHTNQYKVLKNNPENEAHKAYFISEILSLYVKILDGSSRLGLITPQQVRNLQEEPTQTLHALFTDDARRHEVRDILHDAFKQFFVIDTSDFGYMHIAFAPLAPKDNALERSLDSDAIDYFKTTQRAEFLSDGLKAFTGMMISVIADNPKVIIVDEPEAFLHPPLAFKLGRELGKRSKEQSKNIFASTHSSNFLMGCIQSGAPVNVVRLTYQDGRGTARLLQNERVSKLMKHPLLRSAGVLNALFYEFVIVTEADADRAFYQEINERLLAFEPQRGIKSCLFLNAQNKQTIHEIMGPLRELGIPCAAIVDVDIVDSKDGWNPLCKAADISDSVIKGMSVPRTDVYKELVAKNSKYKKNGGIGLLDREFKQVGDQLFDQIQQHGIFVVRHGELESWLKDHHPINDHGPQWLINAFEKMGDDPDADDYVKPGKNDVWAFMDEIKAWFDNSERKGIPSSEEQEPKAKAAVLEEESE